MGSEVIVQRTTLGLDAEKRPLPCRAHTEQAAGFKSKSLYMHLVSKNQNLAQRQGGALAEATATAGSMLYRSTTALHGAVLNLSVSVRERCCNIT